MSESSRHDDWQAGASYEAFMGRWSRQIAPRFLDWFAPADGLDWLDVGCGTGELSDAILVRCNPKNLIAIDSSEGFISRARATVTDPRAEFRAADAQDLPLETSSRDAIASGLVLNFIPERVKALAEMKRVVRPGGKIGIYVWDYPGGGMEMLRYFWEAATAANPAAQDFREEQRFFYCTPEGLTRLAKSSGLARIESTYIEVPTVFKDFNDYWQPFTLGTGPAPGYLMSLEPDARARVKETLLANLPRKDDGSITLQARACAIKAVID